MKTYPSSYAQGSVEEAEAQAKDKRVAQVMFGKGVFTENDLKALPKHQQHQGALEHQLGLLYLAANKLGLYDAADFLSQRNK